MSAFTASDLRHFLTLAEKKLWEHLRAHRCADYKFRRQHQIGRTIVDFVCLREKLVVELDGAIHDFQKGYDARRDAWLRREGYHVIRFRNEQIEQSAEDVLTVIKAVLRNLSRQRSGF